MVRVRDYGGREQRTGAQEAQWPGEETSQIAEGRMEIIRRIKSGRQQRLSEDSTDNANLVGNEDDTILPLHSGVFGQDELNTASGGQTAILSTTPPPNVSPLLGAGAFGHARKRSNGGARCSSSPLVRPTDHGNSEAIEIRQNKGSLGSIAKSGTTRHVPGTPQHSNGHSISYSLNRMRRPSISGAHSELFGSFVGSYEESILNGRMSTVPSKPLTFVARFGVLGFGKCKSSLKCPPHLSLEFPAFYYAVQDYDSPSPYVGRIDMADNLSANQDSRAMYRIPAHGQMQIIIKNSNNTAVKLFLVPYDLRDMPPHSKTIIRQKHYSVGTDAKDNGKETLRYALQLQICCPSKNKFYIWNSQRVVFANRVPDGKELLKVTTQFLEPKYTPWKPEYATDGAVDHPSAGQQRHGYHDLSEADNNIQKSRRTTSPSLMSSKGRRTVSGQMNRETDAVTGFTSLSLSSSGTKSREGLAAEEGPKQQNGFHVNPHDSSSLSSGHNSQTPSPVRESLLTRTFQQIRSHRAPHSSSHTSS